MKLRVVSDGTTRGTHVYDERGDEVKGVQEVTWQMTVRGRATVKLLIHDVPIDVQGDAEVHHV